MSSVARRSGWDESEWIKKQNEAFDLYLRGELSATKIAQRLGLKRADVVLMIDEVKQNLRSTESFKEMSRERLHEMDKHYAMLIKEAWDAVEELKSGEKTIDKVPGALKIIGDLEAKRQEALQKAGIYDDNEMGDMVAEAERKVEEIGVLLKKVIAAFPESKKMIVDGLRRIQDPNALPEPEEVIEGDVID